ncbi:MAG: DUF86 domain-containing protein [Bacteroidales bacterium]|nr:DUF86 domain-containing protein [Bacteroidales bacterium]
MRDKLNDPARLELILEAITNIETFLAGTTTCEAFTSNKILCHAVVYNLQCIGENVYRLSAVFTSSHPQNGLGCDKRFAACFSSRLL